MVGIGGCALRFVMLERLPPATAAAPQLLALPLAMVFGLGAAGWTDVLALLFRPGR